MANLYNSEGYFSPTEYEAMTRIEKEEKAARKAANFRPIVYICSPYAGNIEQNTENAKNPAVLRWTTIACLSHLTSTLRSL